MQYDLDEPHSVLPEYELKPEYKLIAENVNEIYRELIRIANETGLPPDCDTFKRISKFGYLNINLWFHSWEQLKKDKKFKELLI